MKLLDLDERTVLIIDSLLEYFVNSSSTERQFIAMDIWKKLQTEIKGVKISDIRECLELIDELLEVGKYNNPKQFFTIDRTRLNIFHSKGGIYEKDRKSKN